MSNNPLLFLSRTGYRQVTAADLTNFPNFTGPITSTGTTTAVASQTGIGSTFVMNTNPTLIGPVIGIATGTSLSLTGDLQSDTLSTDSVTTKWKLGTHTVGALTAAGSVGVTINGVTYRLLTST